MKVNLRKAVALISGLCLGGCSGFLQPDIQTFKTDILANHPIGSEVLTLEVEAKRWGFRWSDDRSVVPVTLKQSSEMQCLTRPISYGFWAGGTRLICIVNGNGKIREIDVFELVASL